MRPSHETRSMENFLAVVLGVITTPNPVACTGSADPGTCNGATTRYHFDSATRTCSSFTYSGCGGNDDNFETMQGCENVCIRYMTCSCNAGGTGCSVNRECTSCTGDLSALNGTSCAVVGLHCQNGPWCDCQADSATSNSWHCARSAGL